MEKFFYTQDFDFMEVWAHRLKISQIDYGNSLAGLRRLRQIGIDGVEADISFSRDEEVIIYHPRTWKPDLNHLSWLEITLKKFPIITLRELLEFMKNKPGMKCCLDIKQKSEKLVEKTVEMLRWHGLESVIYLTALQTNIPLLSSEPDIKLLIHARKICPEIKTHIITPFPVNLRDLVMRYHPNIISLGWLNEPLIHKLVSTVLLQLISLTVDLKSQIRDVQEMGVKVIGGIANHPDDIARLIDLGVNGIMTDNPYNTKKFIEDNGIP